MVAGPKLIQDSDDEENPDNNRSPVAASNVSPTCQRIIRSSPLSKLPSEEELSTGSTGKNLIIHFFRRLRGSQSLEVLNRQIKDARDNLLKSSSDGPSSIIKSFPSSHQLFESPAGSGVNLRRATTAFSERKEKKPLKTYGSRASQDDSRIFSSNPHVQNHSSIPSTVGTSSFHEDEACEITTEEVRDDLNGIPLTEKEVGQSASSSARNTLKHEFAHGASTFSASPAIMENTSIIADKFLEVSNGSPTPLKLDETSAVNGFVARTTSSKPQDSLDDPASLPTISKRGQAQGEEFLIPDPNDTKPKKRPRFLLDLPDPCKAEDMPNSDYHNVSPTKRARTGRMDKFGNQPNPDDTDDELSLSLSKQQPSYTTSKQSKAKGLHEKDELDDEKLGSDDIGIGLPVEKYQPRPSRSRSGRQDDELIVPVDFSKRPEAIAKGRKKNKRRKTTAFEQLLHENEDETDIVQVKIPSPMKDLKKLRDVPTTNNVEAIDQPQPEVDPSRDKSTAAPPKKRGRPRKQVSGIHEEQEKSSCYQDSPTKFTTAELNKSNTKKRKASLGHDLDQSSADEDLPPPADLESDIPNPLTRSPLSPPFQKDPMVSKPITLSPSPINNSNIQQSSSALQTPPKTAAPAKGPEKHSPINSGKVAYRVGLSKRARIEPLLRVVRK